MSELNTDIDSLLDGSLDDIADLPEFKPYPVGFHKVSINLAAKKMGEKTGIELSMKYIESIELSDPTAIAPKAGDTTNIAFFLDNELGQGQFKNVITALKSLAPEGATNREIMAAAADAVVLVSTKQRADKNDATKVYTQLVNLSLV